MNIIEKLNKMDVKDIQNFDYTKFLTTAKDRPDILVTVGAILAALLISSKIYIHSSGEVKSAQEEIQVLEKKVAVINSYKKKQEDLKQYLAKIPKPINEDNLMNLLTDFAVKRRVQIESFSPSDNKKTPIYTMSGLSLNLSSNDYKDLWLFINDIEQSTYPIHIRRLKALSGQGSKLSVQLEIVSISLKANE